MFCTFRERGKGRGKPTYQAKRIPKSGHRIRIWDIGDRPLNTLNGVRKEMLFGSGTPDVLHGLFQALLLIDGAQVDHLFLYQLAGVHVAR